MISKIVKHHNEKTFRTTRCGLYFNGKEDGENIYINIPDSLRAKVVTEPTATTVPAPLATQNAMLQPVGEIQENNFGVEYPPIPPEQH